MRHSNPDSLPRLGVGRTPLSRRGPFVLGLLGVLAASIAGAQVPAPAASVLGLDSLLETRVSTAAKYGQRVSEVAGSITIITSDDIARYGYRTLDQVLASVPGFYISNDRNYTYVGARGFSRPTDYNNRILLLVDGNTVNEGIFGAAPMGSELAIPLSALERIEILHGPGSALYGTGAVFGVVNLITRSVAAIDGVQVGLRGGSYGQRGVDALFGRRFENGVNVVVSGLWDRSDGQDLYYPEFDAPSTNGGVAHDLDWEQRWGVLGTITSGNLRLHGRYGSRRKAIPTAAYDMAFNAADAGTWDAYGFLELTHEQEFGARGHLTSRAYFNHYGYTGDYPYADSLGTVVPFAEAAKYDALGGELTLRIDLASANRLTIGAELKRNLAARYYSPRNGPRDVDLNGTSTGASAYIQDEHELSRAVSLLAGLRFDGNSLTASSVTPRAALLIRPFETATLKLLYGEAFRAPGVYEAEIATVGYKRNPNLRAERARTLELVWQQQIGSGVLWSSSLFNYRMRDLIDLTLDTASTLYQYRNVGIANSTGFGTGVEARLGSSASGFANYTYQRTVDGLTGDRLTNSPAHLVKAGLTMALAPWLRPGIVMRYESSRRTVYGTATDPSLLTDLNLTFRSRLGGRARRVELGLRLNNLFDARYATPGGIEHLQPAIPQDGRNISAELRYGF